MDIRTIVYHFIVCLLCIGLTFGVPLRLFYPYGQSRGDNTLSKKDDVSSKELQLKTPILFYENLYSSLYVNSNGHLSFGSDMPRYQSTMLLPLGRNVQIIAAFFADVDIRQGGEVYFRETQEKALLQRAAADIQGHFSQFPTFEPLSLFIATWDGVGAYGDSGEGNTFQIVIASDGMDSFTSFLYLDQGINWITSAGKFPSAAPDPPAQVGFDSGATSILTKLPHSGSIEVNLLASESNVNVDGFWIYQIGNLKGEAIVAPDLNTGDGVVIFEPEVAGTTCLEGSSICHSNARCLDFDEGFCCECLPPYIGNGNQCLEPGTPQRLNGKVSGNLNGVSFSNLDMHAFVVTKDGRAYTAISRVPPEIGPQMVTLNTIGGVIGWLFAVSSTQGARNGFMFTGGTFNRSARITYQVGGTVDIRQTFFGHDALNNLRMETYINGSVPLLTNGEKITVDDYKEEYRRVAPGLIRSRSDRTYRVNDVASKYSWDQTIAFDECTLDRSRAINDVMRMSVTRTFVVYDNNDRVVRYAMSNKIGLMTGTDPCREGAERCDPNADCISNLDSFSCECRSGFFGDGFTCQDVDECSIGLNTCDDNAQCYNVPGSFQCQCNQGYRGDGRTCIRDVALCGDSICDDNAQCVYNNEEERAMCECKPGFTLNPVSDTCQPVSFRCNEVDICHENAQCVQNLETFEYDCVCEAGFSGDGEYCEAVDIDGRCDCDSNANCVYDTDIMVFRCVCREGYTGDGKVCALISIPNCDDCHPYAECVFDQASQQYGCQCKPGYQGDGTRCEPLDCRRHDMCDENAQCLADVAGNYGCYCNRGYRGDGRRCEPEGCNIVYDCGNNAQCVPDPRDTSRYICRCDEGFEGDGKVCIQRIVPCNQVDNCSQYGECVYDPVALTYRCRCSRGYEGDGYQCRARGVDCRRDPRLCDPNASCLLNVDEFVCVCNQNYRGDGTSCSRVHDEMNYLLFSRGYSISKVPFQQGEMDSSGSRILYLPGELAIGVTSDCHDHFFYWTDVSGGKVSRASLDGLDKEVVATGFSSPEGIAIDWLARNMYVTDSGLDIIAVVSLNGTNWKTLISEDMVNPRGIVVDPERGVMYWTDWYRDEPTIEKANMDGSERQVFVHTELGLPNGLTIDYNTQQICWGDAGMNRIECIRSDGVGRRIVTEDAPYPFDITFYGNTLYWSDWTINGVPSIHRNGGEKEEALTLPVGGNGRLYGLSAVGDYCPRVTNACYRNNGGCRYLCLPTPYGGRTCECPDDIDEVTCQEIGVVRKKK